MKRLCSALFIGALLTFALIFPGKASGRFDQKLALDKQFVHVLNRLTFGPRPGDIEQIRRTGIEKWIALQLHPERIPENPVLEAKLKSLESLQLATWQIQDKYSALPPVLMVRPPSQQTLSSLPPQQRSRLMNGSVEERVTTLASFDAETRRLILAGAFPQVLDGLPDNIRQEAEKARQAEQDDIQKERRRLSPPLADLLSQDQIRLARTGSKDEKLALINSLDAEKRHQVLHDLGPNPFSDLPGLQREAMKANQPQEFVNAELTDDKLYRAVYSNRQLQEVLVDFWMNHFNVFNGKGQDRVLLTSFERDTIRPHVFGHFKDLLLATAHDPAMLFYLDNWQSQVPREDIPVPPPPAVIRRPGINENYGRELMELHTLGVDGGYTQDDVIAVARAFTGWTIYDVGKYGEFQFNPSMHDRKEKVVLGHTLPAGRGEQDGLDVIDILAHHPSTARFISKELAQRFVADDPPPALVNRMADTFQKTDGDLRAVLQTMFSSPEFLSAGAWRNKLKSPLDFVVSAVRALNADVTDTSALAQRIADLGEPLYGKAEPTGYPNTGEEWANTAGILGRINFATALAAGEITGVRVDISRFKSKSASVVASELLGIAASPAMLSAIQSGIRDKEATSSMLPGLVLSSPDFQRR